MMRKVTLLIFVFPFLSLPCVQAANLDFGEAWWSTPGPDGVQHVNIRCGEDFMDPNTIIVKANIPVELNISTTATLPLHNFVADIPGKTALKADIPVGVQAKSVGFDTGSLGNYTILCRDSKNASDIAKQKRKQGIIKVTP